MAARLPMIATTVSSSTRVKARRRDCGLGEGREVEKGAKDAGMAGAELGEVARVGPGRRGIARADEVRNGRVTMKTRDRQSRRWGEVRARAKTMASSDRDAVATETQPEACDCAGRIGETGGIFR